MQFISKSKLGCLIFMILDFKDLKKRNLAAKGRQAVNVTRQHFRVSGKAKAIRLSKPRLNGEPRNIMKAGFTGS